MSWFKGSLIRQSCSYITKYRCIYVRRAVRVSTTFICYWQWITLLLSCKLLRELSLIITDEIAHHLFHLSEVCMVVITTQQVIENTRFNSLNNKILIHNIDFRGLGAYMDRKKAECLCAPFRKMSRISKKKHISYH